MLARSRAPLKNVHFLHSLFQRECFVAKSLSLSPSLALALAPPLVSLAMSFCCSWFLPRVHGNFIIISIPAQRYMQTNADTRNSFGHEKRSIRFAFSIQRGVYRSYSIGYALYEFDDHKYKTPSPSTKSLKRYINSTRLHWTGVYRCSGIIIGTSSRSIFLSIMCYRHRSCDVNRFTNMLAPMPKFTFIMHIIRSCWNDVIPISTRVALNFIITAGRKLLFQEHR